MKNVSRHLVSLTAFLLLAFLISFPTEAAPSVSLPPASVTPTASPTPTTISSGKNIPQMKASWLVKTTPKTKNQEIIFDWPTIQKSDGYSILFSKHFNDDPGEFINTKASSWNVKSISPGMWYVALRVHKDGDWSETYRWKITVQPITTPTPIVPTEVPLNTGDVQGIRSIKNTVEKYIGSLTKDTTPDVSDDIDPSEAISSSPTAPSTAAAAVPSGKYTCNCKKSCKDISSCAEANFQLYKCGCAARDTDNDGVPCENKCK